MRFLVSGGLGLLAAALGAAVVILNATPDEPAALILGLAALALGMAGIALAALRLRPAIWLGGTGIALGALGLLAFHLAVPAPVADIRPEPVPARNVPGWGQAFDPDHDCDFRLENGQLTITIPAVPHDLSAELGLVNAPRVLRDVEGDFTAMVKLSGIFRPGLAGNIPGRTPFQSGGLLLWQDAGNYVRLERAALDGGGQTLHYALFELRQDGLPAGAVNLPLLDQDAELRLKRRGQLITGAVRQGKGNWSLLPGTIAVRFRPQCKVGVAAVNAVPRDFTLRFTDLQIAQ